MMGILDGFLGNGFEDPRSAAIMALSAGLLQKNLAGGLLGANQAFAESKNAKLKQGLLQAQVDEANALTQERASKLRQQEQAQQEASRVNGLLANAGRPAPGQGGTEGVNAALPPDLRIGAQAQLSAPGIDFRSLYQQGVPFERLKQLAETQNLGQQEVARTVSVPGPNGEKLLQQLDKFGRPVGQPMSEFEAAQFLNLGDRQVATIPRPGVSFKMGQSPDSAASNALGWANNKLQRERLTLDQSAPKGQYDAERGLMIDPRTGQASPVTMNGAPIGSKDKEMTEAQAKANLFSSRMAEADKIINDLAKKGVYRPSIIKQQADTLPEWMPGSGVAKLGANFLASSEQQQVEQAQRNFLNANLRRESGAVIGPSEFSSGNLQYFPQPGDSQAVIEQKARNRATALAGIQAEVPKSKRTAPTETNLNPNKSVVRTGKLGGRTVVQYSDGSTDYAD